MTTKTVEPTAADQSRQAYTAARAAAASAKAEQAAAAAQLQAMKSNLATGHQAATAEEYAALASRVEYLDLLVTGAGAAVSRAERALINDDFGLADEVARHLGEYLKLQVFTVAALPDVLPADLPVLFIVQSKATTKNLTDGQISGQVELVKVRTAQHSTLDGKGLSRYLEGARVRLAREGDAHTDERDGVVLDRVTLTVKIAYAALPEVQGAVHEWRLNHLGQVLVGQVADRLDGRPNPGVSTPRTTGTAETRLLSEKVAEGIRTVVIESEIVIQRTDRRAIHVVTRPQVDSAEAELHERAGEGQAALGRCTGVEIVKSESGRASEGRPISWVFVVRFTFKAKII